MADSDPQAELDETTAKLRTIMRALNVGNAPENYARLIATTQGAVLATLGAAILLGLEVLVAADLIRTITSKPSIEDALILGIIVLIRTVLSMSIQIEIEGVVPWKRALLTSGASLAGREIARDAAAQAAASRTAND